MRTSAEFKIPTKISMDFEKAETGIIDALKNILFDVVSEDAYVEGDDDWEMDDFRAVFKCTEFVDGAIEHEKGSWEEPEYYCEDYESSIEEKTVAKNLAERLSAMSDAEIAGMMRPALTLLAVKIKQEEASVKKW